jgi:Rrf2 family protein
MSEGVEWAVHCCTVLAALGEGDTLPAARLAEYHGVPPAYLAKHLQALTAAGVTASVPGPRGGYRLARPATDISVLDVVLAVDGDETAFRCSEIRQRGPAVSEAPDAYRRPCTIARTMWRAEDAWRAELASVSIADVLADVVGGAAPDGLAKAVEWFQEVQIRRRSRS